MRFNVATRSESRSVARKCIRSSPYLLYTCNIPKLESDTIATFAGNTSILTVGDTCEDTTTNYRPRSIKSEKKAEN